MSESNWHKGYAAFGLGIPFASFISTAQNMAEWEDGWVTAFREATTPRGSCWKCGNWTHDGKEFCDEQCKAAYDLPGAVVAWRFEDPRFRDSGVKGT